MPFCRGRLPVHFRVWMALSLPVALVAVVATAHADPLSLAEAERLALDGEPGHTALLARADALRERSVAAGQLPDPKLRTALANFPLESGGFSTEGMTQAQLGLRQSFPPGQSRALGTRRYELMAREVSEHAGARQRDVLSAVRERWLEAWYWSRARMLVAEQRPLFADLVTTAQSLYAVGRKDQLDVLRAQLELSLLDDRLIEIDRSHETALARLSEWLGADAARPLDPRLPQWTPPPELDALRSRLSSHPALAAADSRIATTSASVDLARERFKPGWALDLAYAFRDGRLPNGSPRSDFVSLAVTVDLPLFRNNRQDREVAAALSERKAATASKQQMLRSYLSQLDAEYARWRQLGRRIELYDQIVLLQARERADAALLAYQSDAGDFSDVVRGFIDDLDTRLDYLRLLAERAQSHAVLANLGGLIQ